MNNVPTPEIQVLFAEPNAYGRELRDLIPKNWKCSFESFDDNHEILEHVRRNQYDVIFGRIGLNFDRCFFEACMRLKVFATPTTGLDHIDLFAAKQANVEVISLKGRLSVLEKVTSTAEHAWALLLACNRSLPDLLSSVKSGQWARGNIEIHQLSGKTLGIIGFGRLGKMLSEYAKAFRMRVIACDPYVNCQQGPPHVELISLDELLAKSDHIILSASFSRGDPPIMSWKEFSQIKKGAIFINISRGELVDEHAMIKAIDDGILKSVGTDVLVGDTTWVDCVNDQSPVLSASRDGRKIVITPHVGGYAGEAVFETRSFLIQVVNELFEI